MTLIGIMGGTFNPIHYGHIAIARAAREQFHLDEIWFMPNHIPAYKPKDTTISDKDRFEMTKRGIQGYPGFKASDFELRRKGKTYTYETMTQLTQKYPDVQFYFIMGADSLYSFEQWIHPEVIVSNTIILAAPRNQKNREEMQGQIDKLNKQFGGERFFFVDCPEILCSSSDIRRQIRHFLSGKEIISYENLSNQLCIPLSVLHYIGEKHLYVDND